MGFEFRWLKWLNPGDDTDQKPAVEYGEFTEDAAQLLAVAAFFLFGKLFAGDAVGSFEWEVWVCALLSLTVYRMLPVWLSYVGSGRVWQTRLFVGWFGPRGLASIVFGIVLLEDARVFGEDFSDLFGVITVTVTASVVLHGASAAWGARAYGRWAEHAELDGAERADMFMTDMDTSMAPPGRWSSRNR